MFRISNCGISSLIFLYVYFCQLVATLPSTGLSSSTPFVCTDSQFACKDGRCIPILWKCDGDIDCYGSKDDEKECAPKTCGEDEFQCHSDSKCISNRWLCDGDPDCHDKSDENITICSNRTCPSFHMACGNTGMCIPLSWQCDDHPDCPGGEDESSTICKKVTCTEDEFQCQNKKCITKRWKCDQDDDCGDMSDEIGCAPPTCRAEEFPCDDSRCIPLRWKCDGDLDCRDGSDEKQANCKLANSTVSPCSEHDFTCLNHDCIHKSWMCDGDNDCLDGSDESNCNVQTCKANEFRCANGHCIPGYLQCNGMFDCIDHSDENCTKQAKKCDFKTQFDCDKKANTCINITNVCNHKKDCLGGEDEAANVCSWVKNKKCPKQNGGCNQYCKENANGMWCECRAGFQLSASDNKTCVDIDECKIPGSCSQTCINTKGSYKCECIEGYTRDPAKPHMCKANGEEPKLFFANRHDIRVIGLETGDYKPLISNTRSVVALDFDYKNKMIYWSDVADEKIRRQSLDSALSPVDVVVDMSINTPDGVAFDWVHQNLYWTDTGKNTIEVYSTKNGYRKTLVHQDLDEPRALVVDPRSSHGWMYWTDWGDEPKIERSGLDGSHRTAIIKTEIKWPNGLTIDYVTNRIFWVDAKLSMIASSDLEGNNRHLVFESSPHLKHPFAISVFEDNVYWTDWETVSILKTNKFFGGEAHTVAMKLYSPMDIHVYHKLKQPESPDRCGANNGGCSHLCLPSPILTSFSAKFQCACPDGISLLSDLVTCNTSDVIVPPSTQLPAATSTQSPVVKAPKSLDVGRIIGIVVGCIIVLIVLLIVIGFVIYRSYNRRTILSLNFDNPVYRKTTEDKFSLEKNQYQPAHSLHPTLEPLTSSNDHYTTIVET